MIAAFIASLFHDQHAVATPTPPVSARVANLRATGEAGACDGHFPADGFDAKVILTWDLLDVGAINAGKYRAKVLLIDSFGDIENLSHNVLTNLTYQGDSYTYVLTGFVEDGEFSRFTADWRFRVELIAVGSSQYAEDAITTDGLVSALEIPWQTVYGRCS